LIGGVAAPAALAGISTGACAFADSETATECVISDPWTQGAGGAVANQFSGNGPFLFHKTLHITGTGSITSPVVGITLAIDGTLTGGLASDVPPYSNATGGPGHMLMDFNAAVLQASDTTDLNDQSGGPIVISTTGNLIMQAGAKILSTNAGDGHGGSVNLDINGDKMVMCGPAGVIDGACGGAAVLGIGTLAFAANATQISISVNETVTPQAVPFYIQVDSEQLLVTARTGAANPRTYSVNRGVNGTTAASHGAGATVSLIGATIDTSTFKAGTVAGNITISVGDFPNNPTGELLMEAGTYVTANGGYQAGVIDISAGKSAIIDGNVLSQVLAGTTGGGNSATTGFDGRAITIATGCGLDVGGTVSSFGRDEGADLVHLESCEVIVRGGGIVESSGSGNTPGHAPPGTDHPNHCAANYPANADQTGFRPDHGPARSHSACIEIWAKVIDIREGGIVRTAPIGNGWIDLFATEVVKVAGGTGAAPFAVDASGASQWVVAGEITVKVKNGPFKGTGNTLQATALAEGGDIVVEAEGTNTPCCSSELTGITLGTSEVEARGSGTSDGDGGTIHLIAYNNAITGENPGVLDLNKFGGGLYGTATLEACIDPATTYTGTVIGNRVDIIRAQCGGEPTFADYVVFNRNGIWSECGEITISGLKFNDLDGNHANNGEPGLGGWTIHITGPNGYDSTAITAGDGSWSKVLPGPGTYTVCEVLQSGWSQTFPQAGQNTTDCATGEGAVGYLVVVDTESACCDTGVTVVGLDFGNFLTQRLITCKEDPNRAALLTRTVNTSQPVGGGGVAGDPYNYWTVQAAYDAAKSSLQSEVIGLFSKTTENLVLNGTKSLTITQCESAQVTAANSALPVWKITSTGKLLIIGPDSVGGTLGWELVTGGHTLKSIRSNGASVAGVRVSSNGNDVSFNNITSSGIGLDILGSSNKFKSGTIGPNSAGGIHIGASKTGNNVSGATIQQNGLYGVWVEGSSNSIQSNKLYKNALGIKVTGASNQIKSNQVETSTGDGIYVAGNSNVIQDNKVSKNGGNGINVAAGTGNNLKSNASNNSGENAGFEFTRSVTVTNGGSNKADGSSIPTTSKCTTFFTGATANCE
jgi:parallel beta-helix repeat protein